MKQQFTHAFMRENCGCYSESKLMNCSFMSVDPVLLSAIVNSEIRLKDKFWFVCKILATKEQNQKIAIDLAEIVLPLYEKQYPGKMAPREAIEAAKKYIKGECTLDFLLKTRKAAAAAAAYAAYAAAAADAAYAAAAADAADAAAAAAAYAAADAAAAAYAADAADVKKQLYDYLKKFVED